MKEYIVVFITCASGKEAALIAKHLLSEKLVACANIVKDIKSSFWWNGKVDKAVETLLILKTTKSNLVEIQKMVRKFHSYEVPEIIALPIVGGEVNYLRWIDESIK